MRVGAMRERVEIQRRTLAQDDYGGPVESWLTLRTRFAAVESVAGSEPRRAEQPQAQITHRVTLRRDTDVTPADRIRWGERVLNITSILQENRWKDHTVIECREVVS